ncbi:MAG: intradiol ring-cleavage dioxygenase [Verrucomicrobiales bacterium]
MIYLRRPHQPFVSRRQFIGGMVASAAAYSVPGAFAEALTPTAKQVEGPFYPDRLPLDTDNDLLIVNDSITPAVGDITHLTGRVRDLNGKPLRNATVEIWQVGANGVYFHSKDPREGRDANFQSYGRFLTDSRGRYYFRTVRPVPYPGRTPHIHVIVSQKGKRLLTTQCYIEGEKLNETDGLLKRVTDKSARDSIIVPFEKVKDSKINEFNAKFDIVIGATPEDQ